MICHNYPDFGVEGWIWGISPGAANAAPDFFGSPDHVLQEKHLLQSPPLGVGMPTVSFWSTVILLGEQTWTRRGVLQRPIIYRK